MGQTEHSRSDCTGEKGEDGGSNRPFSQFPEGPAEPVLISVVMQLVFDLGGGQELRRILLNVVIMHGPVHELLSLVSDSIDLLSLVFEVGIVGILLLFLFLQLLSKGFGLCKTLFVVHLNRFIN